MTWGGGYIGEEAHEITQASCTVEKRVDCGDQ